MVTEEIDQVWSPGLYRETGVEDHTRSDRIACVGSYKDLHMC